MDKKLAKYLKKRPLATVRELTNAGFYELNTWPTYNDEPPSQREIAYYFRHFMDSVYLQAPSILDLRYAKFFEQGDRVTYEGETYRFIGWANSSFMLIEGEEEKGSTVAYMHEVTAI